MISQPKKKSFAIEQVFRENDALVLTSQRGLLRLSPVSDSILRVTYTELETFSGEKSLGICCYDRWADWQYTEGEGDITLRLPHFTATVDRRSGSIRYADNQGALLLRERCYESRELNYFDSYKTVVDKNTVITEVVTPDGIKKRIEEATTVFDRKLCHTTLHLEFAENEHIYGLGQATEGLLDLRGTQQYLHQANMKIAIPFFLSTAGYGFLSATDGVAKFNDDVYGSYFYTDADREMDFYFIYGPEFDDIIRGYRHLTGPARMLPKWAFGYIQSQERYESAAELLDMAKQFKDRDLGLDCLVQDWCTWLPGHWGEKDMDPEFYPDVPGMIQALEEQDVHFMLSIWPNCAEVTRDYSEFFQKNLLLPASDNYNAFDPEAKALYWDQTKRGLFSKGIKAFWCDCSEPFSPEWSEDRPMEVTAMYNEYIRTSSKFIPRDKINAYALVHAQTIYEGMRSETQDYRVCNLTRSAHTGSQRYGTILWSGDISAKWDTLRKQIPAGLNFCASGLPFWTLDIGGFFVKEGTQWFWNGDYDDPDNDLGFRELYTRWFQLGAFLPIFRSHGTNVRREPWHFGEKGEPFYDAIQAAIDLRYRLMPYIYSAAAEASLNGGTMMRMLAFDYRQDEEALKVKDQYLFGKSILVCPVTHPMYYGVNSEKIANPVTTRKVYLPAGNDWFDFYTMERHAGGQWLEVSLTLDKLPLFVKAGSIIPMTESVRNTAQSGKMPIDYRVFPGADAAFTLYEDAGDGYGYEKGDFKRTEVRWDEKQQKLSIH